MFTTLSCIGQQLNNSNVVWGVGASLLLNKYGFIHNPNDIDIFVDINDIDKADKALKHLGEKKQSEMNSIYLSRRFYEYVINGFDVDVIAGFRVKHPEGVYEHVFDKSSISEYSKINGVDIPFTSLEDWYVIYQLIPNRDEKVKMIESYFISNGIKKPALLERTLRGNLPVGVRARGQKLLRVQ